MIKFKSNKTNYCKFCKESEKAKIKNVKISYEYENPEAYGFPEVRHWTKDVDIFFCPMCGRKIEGSKIAAAFKDPDVQRIFAEMEGAETGYEESRENPLEIPL